MKRSISTRLMLSILPLVILGFMVLVGGAYLLAMNSQQNLAYQQVESQAAQYANSFDAELGTDQALSRTLAQVMEANATRDRQEVMNALKSLLDQHPELLGTYVCYEPNAFDGKDANFFGAQGSDATGRFIPYWNRLTGQETLDPVADLDTSAFYLIPKQTKADSVIEPFLYQDVLMTSFISPILKPDGSFIGIAGADTSLTSWDQRVKQIKTFSTGYAWLVSNTGIFISAPDASLIGQKTLADLAHEQSNPHLSQMADDIKAGKAGFIQTTDPFTGKSVALFYAPIKTGNWSLITVVPTSEILASVNQMRNLLLGIGFFILILLFAAVFFVAKSFAKPIQAVSRAANQIALGDLNIHLDVHQQDEIGQMAEDFRQMAGYLSQMARTAQQIAAGDLTEDIQPLSEKDILGNVFAQMVANLRDLVSQVMDNADNLQMASAQLAQSASQAGEASSQIATTIQQVARGTTQQTEAVTRTAASVEQMSHAITGVAKGAGKQSQAVNKAAQISANISAAIQQVSANAEAGAKGSIQAAEVALSGSQTVTVTISGMQTIQSKVALSAQKVAEMGAKSQQIGSIVEKIEEIASQTNLLALNAAIEAARAGDGGRGFAVVADEVRKLAERASSSTKEIAALVTEIQITVSQAVTAMQDGSVEVESGVAQANRAGQALGEILSAVEMVNRQVSEIAQAAQQMGGLSTDLMAATEAVSMVVEDNTAATEQMSASSSEVGQAMENIASVSEENSAAVEEVSASAEEMSAQVEEVTGSAQSLAEMAEALQQVVAQFKLSNEPQRQRNFSAAKAALPGSHPAILNNGNNGYAILAPSELLKKA